jgi:hypothetical protein
MELMALSLTPAMEQDLGLEDATPQRERSEDAMVAEVEVRGERAAPRTPEQDFRELW